MTLYELRRELFLAPMKNNFTFTRDELIALIDFYEARRTVSDNPACGLSWSGFNISGDEKSVQEVRHLVNVAGRVKQLEDRIKELEARRTVSGQECRHEIVDARNEYIESGYLCVKCHSVFAGRHAAPIPATEPKTE